MDEEKSCAAKVEKTTGSFTFTLSGWSDVPNRIGESTESPEFEICGKQWQLRIFPGGSLELHSGYVSYYLASKSATVTRASYKLFIINQSDPEQDALFASSGIRKFEAKGIQVDGWGRDKFIDANRLKDRAAGLCVENTIIFKVEITVIGGLAPMTKSSCVTGTPIKTLSKSLLEAMTSSKETFADLSINIDGHDPIKVHKCILSARSPVFHAMLTTPMSEGLGDSIDIPDMDHNVMLELIRFIYSDNISSFNILDSILYDLYMAGNKYQIKGLISICENRIIETLNASTSVDALRVTDVTGHTKKMKEQIMLYIVQHFNDVCITDGYKRLVENSEDDEQASILMEELHTEVCNSNTDLNCLGLVNSMLQKNPKMIKLEKIKVDNASVQNNARVGHNTCSIM